MKYRLTVEMDIAVIDEKYPNIIKHRRKKAIGDPITITGTKEEIIRKTNDIIYELVDLSTAIFVEGEESVILNKQN